MENFSFKLYSGGASVLEPEGEKAYAVYSYLEKKGLSKRFKQFLNSPYLVEKSAQMAELFSELERKEKSKPTGARLSRRLRLDPFIDKYYKTRKSGLQNVSALLRQFSKELDNFEGYEHLKEQPEELARIKSKSLLNQGQKKRFTTSLNNWGDIIARLPAGRHRSFHQWDHAHIFHFNLDLDEHRGVNSVFPNAWEEYLNFTNNERLRYENERLCFFRNNPDSKLPAKDSVSGPLSEVYEAVLKLQLSKCKPDHLFNAAKEKFLNRVDEISPDDGLMLLLLLQNCTAVRYKLGIPETRKEIIRWNKIFVEKEFEKCYKGALPKYTYLNRLHNACIADDLEMAQRIVDRFCPRLLPDLQRVAKLHGEVTLMFYSHNYEGVLEAMKKLGTGKDVDAFADGTRFKSFDLRAHLVLFAKAQVDHKDMISALERYRKFLSFYQKSKRGGKDIAYLKIFEEHSRKIVSAMHRYRYPSERAMLIKRIEEAEKFHAKMWLLNFLDELKRFPQEINEIKPSVM